MCYACQADITKIQLSQTVHCSHITAVLLLSLPQTNYNMHHAVLGCSASGSYANARTTNSCMQATRARKEREAKELAVAEEARLRALHGPDWKKSAAAANTSPELQQAGKSFLSWLP